MPFDKSKMEIDAAAVTLIQHLRDGLPVRLVDAVTTGRLPPFLIVETVGPGPLAHYRLELIVVAAEVTEADAPAQPAPNGRGG